MTTSDPPPSDAELVARCREHDPHAFGSLIARHQGLVFGVALARCGDPALAEDLAQDAFVVAWRDLERLRDVDRVGSWIAGIARNLAFDASRTSARRAAAQPPEPPPVATPEDHALDREDRELVRSALMDVAAAHREVLVLFYLEGESIARIARSLAIREDLVKQRLARGRKALRESVAVRVERTLGRLRPSAGFGAAVVAAALALGKRDVLAATTGKVITAMTAKTKIAIGAAAIVVVAATAVAVGTQRASSPTVVEASNPAASAARSAGSADPVRPRVRRMADPAARPAMLERIRAARQRSANGSGSRGAGTKGSSAGPGDPPAVASEYTQAAIEEINPMLLDCYREGMERVPELAGTLAVEFTIEGDPENGGLVTASNVDADWGTMTDPGVRECIQETMYALEIDPPAGGNVITIRTELRLSQSEDETPDDSSTAN
ncbi:MAG: sigma-70 family RNA polymerase sigma factor [Kofleriaceae bacterium]